MVDAASKMECQQCMGIFPTTYFYDHIVSSSSQCAQMLQDNFNSKTSGDKNLHQEDFTLCLEEESCMGSGNKPKHLYDSNGNFQNTLQKMTQTARSRAAKNHIINSKEFMHGTHQYLQNKKDKDKFAMTHGSADFKMLKTSNNGKPNFFKENLNKNNLKNTLENSIKEQIFIVLNQGQGIKQVQLRNNQQQNDFQTTESFYRDANIPRPRPKQKQNQMQTTQQIMLETPSSQNEQEDQDLQQEFISQSKYLQFKDVMEYQLQSSYKNCDDNDTNSVSNKTSSNMINVHLKMNHQLSTYDQVNHQTSDQQFDADNMPGIFDNYQVYDTQDLRKDCSLDDEEQQNYNQDDEDNYQQSDSLMRENRIRQVADYETEDVGVEGDKSTYLRPSRVNKSTSDINRSQIITSQRSNTKDNKKMGVKQINSSQKPSTTKNSKLPNSKQIQLQSRNKENGNIKNTMNLQKLNTCRAGPVNVQYPLTFRNQDMTNQENKKQQNKNLPRYGTNTTNVQEPVFKNQKAPQTSKKCAGNRYNTLLRCSSSANGNNNSSNSFVSPKNLMFGGGNGAPRFIGVDISGFEPQQNMGSPTVQYAFIFTIQQPFFTLLQTNQVTKETEFQFLNAQTLPHQVA